MDILTNQVDHLAVQLGIQQQLTRELLRDVTHASQAQAVAMQDFIGMIKAMHQAQQLNGPCERRVATDETEYEAWVISTRQQES
jgi:hypothetical protein